MKKLAMLAVAILAVMSIMLAYPKVSDVGEEIFVGKEYSAEQSGNNTSRGGDTYS